VSASSEETWLFDLGNSRAKAARLLHGAPADVVALDWMRGDFVTALRTMLAEWPAPRRVLVASVAASVRAEKLADTLQDFASGSVEWLRSPRQACGVVNRYAVPERLGIDRFLAAVAARARGGAGIVIGCGTALTLDAVAADGMLADGMISLSPSRMLEALRGTTAIADDNPDAFAEAINDDTARALQAGCRGAAGALVEWFAARQRHKLGEAPLWLHGGWARTLAAWLADDGCPAEMMDNAVLEGLAVWAGQGNVE
jgi:type III pantothenate kinase